jgi:phosphatidylglycerophosphate synthase
MSSVQRKQLLRSIASVLLCCGSIETAGFLAVSYALGFSSGFVFAFLAAQAIFHGALALFLILSLEFFFIERTGERLTKVNIANKVTLLRISMLPSVLFLILAARDYPIGPILVPVIAATFLTDLVDGRLSRAKNQVTLIGRILDSVSDYSLLIVIAVAYRAFGILPLWLFTVILARFLFQAIGMLCVLLARKRVEPKTTVLGKVAVATTMALFAAEALRLVAPRGFSPVFAAIEYLAGIIVAVSVLDKGVFFAREAKKGRAPEELNRPNG